jgi:stage III sporulation protein AA
MSRLPHLPEQEILPFLAPRLAALVSRSLLDLPAPVEEIRLRQDRSLQLCFGTSDGFITESGSITTSPAKGVRPNRDDLMRTFQLIAKGSVYAWEDEVRTGFLTLPGGHRVGLAGRAVTEAGRILTLKHVSSLNIRIAREIPGVSTPLLPRLIEGGRVRSTLLISPPGAGKTTLLRDLIRQISTGVPALGLPGLKVGLVDERSELAGCTDGVPQRDLGPRTDVLDACPKAEGMMLMIRSLSPQVLAVDEIGREADAIAAMEALHAGVTLLATAHGASLDDISLRPALSGLLQVGMFTRAVVLGRSRGPGTIERVIELDQAQQRGVSRFVG